MMFDICREKLIRKMGVYCRSDGAPKLLSCTRSGILQAASAVRLTVVLCDLAYVSSKQTVLHCAEPSALHSTLLFRWHTGRDWVAVIKAAAILSASPAEIAKIK